MLRKYENIVFENYTRITCRALAAVVRPGENVLTNILFYTFGE